MPTWLSDRGIWFGNWVNNHSVNNMLFVKARRAEFAARQGVSNFSVTGYWIKKLVSMGTVGAADGNVTGSNQTALSLARNKAGRSVPVICGSIE